jgi:tetratricopeptide (TPR) repeat protein
MTMKQILLAPAFVLLSVTAASAQPVGSAQRVEPAERVEPFRPAPVQIEPFHVEPIQVEPFYVDAEHIRQLAQDIKPFKQDVKAFQLGLESINFQSGQKGSQLDSAYSQARGFIDRDQYDRALDPLDRVISAKSERADAATYWKAYSLWKLARRDEALSVLTDLQKQFPDSRWVRDARALEVEVKQAAGQTVSANAANDELKLLALQGLTRTDPEAAFPVIEKMLAGGSSVRVKERALFVLSQSRADRARTILSNVARGNANPELQQTAIRYLGISNTPDAAAALEAIYKSDTSVDTKKAVISALMTSHNNTQAITTLVTLARAERNPELKTTIVRYLSTSRAPEARQYMLELLQ